MIQNLLANLISLVGIKTILVSTFILYLFHDKRKKQFDKSLPPLAPGYIPVIGHLGSALKQMPLHETLTNWSKEVGPIFTCYFGSQRWIILNDQNVVKDLIVDRGSIYSSRNLPDTITEDVLQGEKGAGITFFKYGPAWRRLRRIAHGGMAKSRINDYQPIIDESRNSVLSYLYDLFQSESNTKEGVSLHKLFEYYTMITILSIIFGNMYSFEAGDPILHDAYDLTEAAAQAMSPADQLRQFFPILNILWPVKREKYLKVRDGVHNFYGGLLNEFKSKYEKDPDSIEDCFLKEILNNGEMTDIEIETFVSVFVGAGSDTTTTTLKWLIPFLANHPDVQEKAFKEIEQVVGLDRLPSADDEPNLPYVQSIILETLRLRPPVPLAVPHANSSEDVYNDWVIPKETVIIMNLYGVNVDERSFPDPHKFDPERYMNNMVQRKIFAHTVEDRPHLTFSTGRRVCVGIHLAERSLFMIISMLLATFKFERISDELIDARTPKDLYTIVYTPKDCKVRLVPRHDHIPEFIN